MFYHGDKVFVNIFWYQGTITILLNLVHRLMNYIPIILELYIIRAHSISILVHKIH